MLQGDAAQLVRDVFVATDCLHEDAMSQMGASTNIGDDGVGVEDVDGESAGIRPETSTPWEDEEVVSDEGAICLPAVSLA